MAPTTKVCCRVELNEDVLLQYEIQAAGRSISIEALLAERLTKCIDHNASRGMYFNDADRSDLETLFGGRTLATAPQAIAAGKAMATVTVGGVNVELDQTLVKRAASRAQSERTTIEKWLAREIIIGLERTTGIR